MKLKLLLISALPSSLFAHAGHGVAESHGNFTHLLLGCAVALPAGLIGYSLFARSRKKAEVRVKKQD